MAFPGEGEVVKAIRSKDWSGSSLGNPVNWPLSLTSVVRLMLDSKFPMFVAWGPELCMVYNDAYFEILGDKHPESLGAPFAEVWQEIWHDVNPIAEAAINGKSSFFEDLPLTVYRGGYPEKTWFTFSYSPLRGDDGTTSGFYCAVVETTKNVRDRNLKHFQLHLADRIHLAASPEAIVVSGVTELGRHLEAAGCWYAEVDDWEGTFQAKRGWFKENMPDLPKTGKFEDFGSFLLPTLRAGVPFICNDVSTDARTSESGAQFIALNIGSILIVPVLRLGRLAFTINVAKVSRHIWTEEDIRAAKDVVDRTWISVENAITKEKLKAERGQSDQILNQMDEGFMVVGADDRVNRINAKGLRLLHRTLTEVLGNSHLHLWPDALKDEIAAAFKEVMVSGAATIMELNFASDAAPLWLDLRASKTDQGLAVFFRDMTRQKEYALALRRSEQHLNSLFEHTAAGIAERDLEGRIIRVNERLCELLERSREQVIGVNIHDLTHPEDRARSVSAFETLLRNGESFDIEKRYLKPDGSPVWVSTTVSLVKNFDADQSDSVLAVILDITERKRAEEALQDETRVLELLNNSGESLASTLDLNTLLQTVTDTGRALTGAEFGAFFYNGKDDQGDGYVLFTLSGAPREAFEGFGHPRATPVFKPTFVGEPPVRSDDITQDPRYGSMAPHHGMPKGHLPVRSYLAAPVISRSGEPIGGLFFGHSKVAVFTERTERLITALAAQAAIAIDNARLYDVAQKAALERQTLLANETASRAEAERLNRAKDEFLAMLAHELRNPLAPVSAAAELLRITYNDPDRVCQISDILSRQIGHFTRLIDDLMDVSRATRGLVTLNNELLDVRSIIEVAVEQVRPVLEARQHSLTTSYSTDNATVFGDRTRLVQVAANLLTNAAKYTANAGVISVTIQASQEDIAITVGDGGKGIESSLLPHVFDLFTQGGQGLDRSQGGLGIGLALVKAIVTLHRGTVTAYSDGLGLGSRFTVTIPRAHDDVRLAVPGLQVEPVLPSSHSILLVDDNIDGADSLGMLLTTTGHSVQVAATAAEAVLLSNSENIDVFIFDIGLPDMSGYDLAKMLRNKPTSKDKLFIALTGYGQPLDRDLSKEAGFDHHMVKPVDYSTLCAVLNSVTFARHS